MSTHGSSGDDGVAHGGASRGRGSARGRDGGGTGKSKKRDIMDGLLPDSVKTILKPQDIPDEPNAEISNVQYLASYNWIGDKTPTIIVPGSPRIWSPPELPVEVQPAKGQSFVDQNGHRLGANALVPIFEAIDTLDVSDKRVPMQWSSVDFVTDRNNLMKLIAFVDPACGKKYRKEFRIDVELAGPWTILFRRWEERTSVGSNGLGFGDSFEHAISRPAPGCERGTLAGHHRVVTYDFAGLKIVLRCEVDAYQASGQSLVDSLTDQLSSLDVNGGSSGAAEESQWVKTIRGGSEVPQSSLLKIKSRSQSTKGNFLNDAYIQLYLGQMATLCTGIHDGKGVFTSIRERRLDADDFGSVKEKVQPGLRKLRRLLEEIQSTVIERGQGAKLSLVCRDSELRLMQRASDESLLPLSLLVRFTS